MKYGINKKMVLLATLSSLSLSGCISKYDMKSNLVSSNQFSQSITKTWKTASKPWKNVKSSKKDVECVNCYATSSSTPKVVDAIASSDVKITYDYSNTPSEMLDTEYEVQPATEIQNANYHNGVYDYNDAYVSGTTIQVGAYKRYAKAKKAAKKYDLLASKYNVKIDTEVKRNERIHCVRIEGFDSKNEAKKFMNRYAISDAFLVRR